MKAATEFNRKQHSSLVDISPNFGIITSFQSLSRARSVFMYAENGRWNLLGIAFVIQTFAFDSHDERTAETKNQPPPPAWYSSKANR